MLRWIRLCKLGVRQSSANFPSHFCCFVSVCISFDISRTSCYITGSVALKMELLVLITQIKWLLKRLVDLLIRRNVDGSLC